MNRTITALALLVGLASCQPAMALTQDEKLVIGISTVLYAQAEACTHLRISNDEAFFGSLRIAQNLGVSNERGMTILKSVLDNPGSAMIVGNSMFQSGITCSTIEGALRR